MLSFTSDLLSALMHIIKVVLVGIFAGHFFMSFFNPCSKFRNSFAFVVIVSSHPELWWTEYIATFFSEFSAFPIWKYYFIMKMRCSAFSAEIIHVISAEFIIHCEVVVYSHSMIHLTMYRLFLPQKSGSASTDV